MKNRFCIFAIILILINIIVFPLSAYAENSEAIKNNQTESSTTICAETTSETENSSEKDDSLSLAWIIVLIIVCIVITVISIKLAGLEGLEVFADLVEMIADILEIFSH